MSRGRRGKCGALIGFWLAQVTAPLSGLPESMGDADVDAAAICLRRKTNVTPATGGYYGQVRALDQALSPFRGSGPCAFARGGAKGG